MNVVRDIISLLPSIALSVLLFAIVGSGVRMFVVGPFADVLSCIKGNRTWLLMTLATLAVFAVVLSFEPQRVQRIIESGDMAWLLLAAGGTFLMSKAGTAIKKQAGLDDESQPKP